MAFQLRHFFRRESGLVVLPSAAGEGNPGPRQSAAGSSMGAPRGTATVRELRKLIPAGEAAAVEAGGDSLVLLPMSAVASGRMRLRELWECAPFLFRGEVAAADGREVVLGEEPAAALEQPERSGGLWSRFAELGEPLAAAALQFPPGGSPGSSQDCTERDRMRGQAAAEKAGPVEVAALLGTLPGVRACALSVAGEGSGSGGDAGISCALREALPQTEAAYRNLAAGLSLGNAEAVTVRAGEQDHTMITGRGVFLVVAHGLPELSEHTVAQCVAAVQRLASPG